jgi:hypothetical protein
MELIPSSHEGGVLKNMGRRSIQLAIVLHVQVLDREGMTGLSADWEEAGGLNLFEGPVHDCLQFAGIFQFAAFGEDSLGILGREPGGMAHFLLRTADVLHFHEEGFDHEFLYAGRLPENPFGVNVLVKMARLDASASASFFRGFAFRRLAVGQGGSRVALGEGPFISAVRVDQKELDQRPAPVIAHGSYLQRQLKPWQLASSHARASVKIPQSLMVI